MKLHEQSQFTPTRANIAYLLELYGYSLASFELTDSGIENCTVIAATTHRKLVLRIYRQDKKSDADILREITFTQYLHAHGIPVAEVLPATSGEYLTHIQDGGKLWQAVAMPHAIGQHAKQYDSHLLHELASIQARMHMLAADYGDHRDQPAISVLQESQFIPLIQDRHQLDGAAQAFVRRAEEFRVELAPGLPRGLCHLDFGNGNVLSNQGNVTAVLDFDDLAVAPFAMCLAYTLWDVLYTAGPRSARVYIDRYNSLRSLNDLEKGQLNQIALFRHYTIGCLKIAHHRMDNVALTRYLDIENRLLRSNVLQP